jgi:hypothetical protein
MRGSDCLSCTYDSGLSCNSGLASSKEGYWAYLKYDSILELSVFETSLCPNDYCKGSLLQNATAADEVTLNNNCTVSNNTIAIESSFSLLSQQCTFPRQSSSENALCGECADGYTEWSGSYACIDCRSTRGEVVLLLLLISIVIVVFLFQSISNTSGAEIQVFLFFLQTAMLELGNNAKFLTWLRWINLRGDSTSLCLGPFTPYEQTLFNLLVPLILLTELVLLALLQRSLQYCTSSRAATSTAAAACGKGASTTLNTVNHMIGKLHAWSQQFSLSTYIGASFAILYSYCFATPPSPLLAFVFFTVDK